MNTFFKYSIAFLLVANSQVAFSQQLMRDNLGSHIATKDLNLNGFNINGANAVNAVTAAIGSDIAVTNTSVALQVDGTGQTILIPRVTDLLNNSVITGNALAGMIAYDVATDKFYVHNTTGWVTFATKSIITSGIGPVASGLNSFAVGRGTIASALNSFAYGGETTASNNECLAGGYMSTASGLQSTVLGVRCTASGVNSLAIGNGSTASGDYSAAIGVNVSTNSLAGSMCFGDYNNSYNLSAAVANQMNMRFDGGYRLFTNAGMTAGVLMTNGANSWSVISDKRKKENLETANAESFLIKIDTMALGSWNYKKQNAKKFRHYGPMAQDFYAAFGKDSYGTIGCDTLIASSDFDGVNMIAIKGLVKRTNALAKENDTLKVLMAKNTLTISTLLDKNEKLTEKLQAQENNSEKMQAALVKLQRLMEKMAAVTAQEAEGAYVANEPKTNTSQ